MSQTLPSSIAYKWREETKTADLPMADQKVAESREQTDYIPWRFNRNRTVIEPQAGGEAVKVVKAGIAVMGIAGSIFPSCKKCECAYNDVLNENSQT